MNTSFITFTAIICLIVLAAAGISHAGEKARVFEMADGNVVEFKMTPEEIAAHEAKVVKQQRSLSALRIKPKKYVLVFEMGESGITISFPATDKEAAEQAENPGRLKPYNAISNQSHSNVETVELAESGFYFVFPVSRDNDTETKTQFYSQEPK